MSTILITKKEESINGSASEHKKTINGLVCNVPDKIEFKETPKPVIDKPKDFG